jgi:hypothetical protein
LLSASIFLGSCRPDTDNGAPKVVDNVAVAPPEATVETGKTVSLTAQLVDGSGKTITGTGVQWTTSNAAAATVSTAGVVTGVATGVARITAAAGSRSGSAVVSVPPQATTQAVPAGGGTVSTPGGEVKVTMPNGALPGGGSVTITAVTTAPAPGTTVPGTVYKIGVFGVTAGARPTITVRYSVQGLPPGFDETKLALSRKIGAFWVPLPSQVNTVDKTITATLPAGSAGSVDEAASASFAALDEEATVGATLYAFEVDPASVQLTVGDRRTVTGRIRSLVTGNAVTAASPNASTNPSGVATVSAATISGNDIRAEVVAVAPGTAVITLSGSVIAAGASESFGGSISVGVAPQASLIVNVGGLPTGVNAAVIVTGPNGFNRSLTGSQTIPNVAAGTYTITAQNVTASGQTYVPTPATQQVTLGNGESKTAAVTYAGTLGGLIVNVDGLPSGANASVMVTGPNNFSTSVTQTRTLTSLAAGTYTITASNVTASGQTYVPTPATQSATVAAGQTATATVTYGVGLGGLALTVAGLPPNVNAVIMVTGPGGFTRTVSNTQTVPGLTPGTYTVQASPVTSGGTIYSPATASQTVTVAVGQTATVTVTYAASTGALAVTVSGLPAGANAVIVVTGPNGYTRNVPSSQTITGLAPGAYTVTASNVSAGGQTYAPSPPSRAITIVAGATETATVTYAVFGGSLTVTISGLPAGVAAVVLVTGPGGFSRAVSSTETLTGLITAPFNVTASNVVSGGQTYVPTPASQIVSVTVGQTSQATVTYAAPPPVLSSETSWVDACPAVVVAGTPVTVRVFARTQSGGPVPNASVSLTVSGTGNQFTASLTTNANGSATTSFTSTVAQTKTITARLTSGTTSITATGFLAVVAAPSGAQLTKISGDDQQIKVGTSGAAFVVEARTANGVIEPNVPVHWEGFKNCFFTTTGADGRTRATFTFPYQNSPEGPSTITAQTSAGATAQFTYRYIP